MSDFMFSPSRKKVTRGQARELERIAKSHGAVFVEVEGAQFGGYQSWFCAANLGFPFDDRRAADVAADVAAAGIER